MNTIWISIIIISIIFSFVSGNLNNISNTIFDVPNKALNNLLDIGCVIIIYTGLFNIAIKSKLINKIAFIFNGFVEKVFKIKKNTYLNDLISISITANMLGLGAANTVVSIKVVNEMKIFYKENFEEKLAKFLLLNVSSFTILPISLISFRSTYNASINLIFIPLLFISSFITTLFSLIIIKVFYK